MRGESHERNKGPLPMECGHGTMLRSPFREKVQEQQQEMGEGERGLHLGDPMLQAQLLPELVADCGTARRIKLPQ
jgi:hypothetical protein